MARNEEKAAGMMNRWTTFKGTLDHEARPGGSYIGKKRPYLSSHVDDLHEAEHWRRDILREITKKVAEIQNAGLGEHVLRDMNDSINKLLREKGHWQKRIKDLGGPDYFKSAPRSFDAEGKELRGSGGYQYFGATKNLPDVRKLFENEVKAPRKRTRHQINKNIDPDYYGFRDEDDGILVEEERKAEAAQIQNAVHEWQEIKKLKAMARGDDENEASPEDSDDDGATEEIVGLNGDAANNALIQAHIEVPSLEAIQEKVLARRKAALLADFDLKGIEVLPEETN